MKRKKMPWQVQLPKNELFSREIAFSCIHFFIKIYVTQNMHYYDRDNDTDDDENKKKKKVKTKITLKKRGFFYILTANVLCTFHIDQNMDLDLEYLCLHLNQTL